MGRITRGFGQPWAKITCGFGLSWAKLPMGLGYHAQNSLGWRVTRSRAHSTSTSTRRARPPHHDDGGVMESWRMRELAHARTTTELLLLSPRWAECHAKQSHMALGVRVCVVFPRWAECHAKPSHMALDVRVFVCVFVCVLCSPGGQSATQGHHSWLQPCVGSVHLRTLPWQRRFRRPVGGQRPWRVHLQGPLATVQDDDRSRT